MNYPDLINASFELSGGFFVLNHCRVLLRDKEVKGVSIISTVFFALWGLWNLGFYYSIELYISWIGGMIITFANFFWIYLLIKYKNGDTKIQIF